MLINSKQLNTNLENSKNKTFHTNKAQKTKAVNKKETGKHIIYIFFLTIQYLNFFLPFLLFG